MTDRLVAVALLPSAELARQVQGIRSAVGDPRRFDLPPHLTLVPPIALDHQGATAARVALRSAAAEHAPFRLELGPAATFAPRTSTLHLTVAGELDQLQALRDGLRVAPWDRPDEHAFVPHMTLLSRATQRQIDAGLELFVEPLGDWTVESLVLLERLRLEDGPIWHPVAAEPLGGPDIVGRGGIEVHLRSIDLVEPAVAELLDPEMAQPLPQGGTWLVTVAEAPGNPGVPIGAAFGRADRRGGVLQRLAVAEGHRGQGVARHVVAHWCTAAVRRGTGVVAARHVDEALAAALGFTQIDATTWCRRVGTLDGLGSPT